MRKNLLIIGAMISLLLFAGHAWAQTVISKDSGSGTLDSYSITAGTQGTPWLISESISGAFTLKFYNATGGNVLMSPSTFEPHATGNWFSKTVTNTSGVAWYSFELELQVNVGTPSLDGDGLSFAQGSGLTFSSDKFSAYSAIEDIRDYLNFHNGIVNPNESVTFIFAMSDNGENNPFYLLETPNKSEVSTPEPFTMLLLGLGLTGLAGLRRRFDK